MVVNLFSHHTIKVIFKTMVELSIKVVAINIIILLINNV